MKEESIHQTNYSWVRRKRILYTSVHSNDKCLFGNDTQKLALVDIQLQQMTKVNETNN